MQSLFQEMLKTAKLPERSIPICLRGDLAADHEAAERSLESARRCPVDSLDGSGTGTLIEHIENLQAQMAEHTYTFRMRALVRSAFRALIAAHPPRRGDDNEPLADDVNLGLNRETFFDALIRACTIDPELTEPEWRDLLDQQLTDRQYDDLSTAAWLLNRGEVDVPFSALASREKRNSATE
jgi:hypothetical protein